MSKKKKNILVPLSEIVPTNRMEEIELAMLESGEACEEEIMCPLQHHFSPGVYVREITMPANTYILGHKHHTTHINILSKGSCILADVDTGETIELIAPCTFESKEGVQKLLYIVEECVWSTVHVTEETDISKLEDTLFNYSRICKLTRDKDKYIGGR